MTNIIKNKYNAVFILHALGDTLGFKNGDWEFNYNKEQNLESVFNFIYEFIELGGVNGINLKDWLISDDTLYHMGIGNAMLKFKGKIDDKFKLELKDNLILIHNRIMQDDKTKNILRYPGIATEKYIEKFTEKSDENTFPYDKLSGGNGAAMRNLCIGLVFHDSKDLNNLIDVSIISSKLTHNSPIGFLAGLTSAYFISLAISNIHMYKWVPMLIKLLESDYIKKYIDFNHNEIFLDYITFIRLWKKYYDTKFSNEEPLQLRIFKNFMFRIKYYFLNFVQNTNADFIGGSGICCMIMAYDSLIDCDGKWEKLIFYAILHPGDSDTIGAIAGGLYGAVYGFGDVPEHMMAYLEEKKELENLGNTFFNKFANNII